MVDVETCLSRSYLFVDGLTLVNHSGYTQVPQTIDLFEGEVTLDFASPTFTDENANTVVIHDPTDPLREIYFKVVDQESEDPEDYMFVTTADNSLNSAISVLFEETTTSVTDYLQIVSCFSYGIYTQLQNLCDVVTLHEVINARGRCFKDPYVRLNEGIANSLMDEPTVFLLGSGPVNFFDLA